MAEEDRPSISCNLSSENFRSYYYLKEELVAFCREVCLQSTGGKIELTDRIAHYLDTGEKRDAKSVFRAKCGIDVITENSLIEPNFICSEKHRSFFKEVIGSGFHFNVIFQKWLKNNTGETYHQAIKAYYQILEDKKNSKSQIDKQFEYNTYIRDFFADNRGKTLDEAINCWRYKKRKQGHNRYEREDINEA